ncbi:hypothetical protein KKE28_03140, partial [Patescibacteria group bacterium]|nr:hypothetical protein [Patescibacteria group bacterium]
VQHYNHERRHTGLSMNKLTPAQKVASVYLSRTVHYPHLVTGTLQQYIYGQEIIRRVTLFNR